MQEEIYLTKKQQEFIITNKSCIEQKPILTEEEQEKRDLKYLHLITNKNIQPSQLKKDLTSFYEAISSINIPSTLQLGKVVNKNNTISENYYENKIKSFNNNLNSFHERINFIKENNKKFKTILNFIHKLIGFGFSLDKNFDINENDFIIDPDKIILSHKYLKCCEDLFNMENKNFRIIYSPINNTCKITSDFYDYYNNEYFLNFNLKIKSNYFSLKFDNDFFDNKLLELIKQKRVSSQLNELQYTDDMFLFYKKYLLYKFMKEEINGILRYLKEKKEKTFENNGLTFICSRMPGILLIKCEYFDNYQMIFTIGKCDKKEKKKINDNKIIDNMIINPKILYFCEILHVNIKYPQKINNFISKVKRNPNLTLDNIVNSSIFIKNLTKLSANIIRLQLNHLINMRCKELNIINTDFLDSNRYLTKYQLYFRFIQNGNEFFYNIYLFFDNNLNLRIYVKEPYLNHIYINDKGINISIEKGKVNFKEIFNILKNIVLKLSAKNNGTYLKIISS